MDKYSTWIDGTNPGHTKAWVHFANPNASVVLKSATEIVPTFKIATGDRWEGIKNDLLASLKNMNTIFANNESLDMIRGFISPLFIDMVQYVSNNYVNYSDNQLLSMFEKLNNGSFDMNAIEYATKGVKNIPDSVYPDVSIGIKMIVGANMKNNELTGFASFTSPLQLAPWFYGMSNSATDEADRRAKGYSNPADQAFYWTAPMEQ